MTIEPFYSPTHLPILNSWLNARECPPATDLPVLGLVVSVDYENVAMGFLRFCEGGYALFDGLCTNPAMPPDTRSHALDLLVSSLIGKSKQLQLKGIMAWSKDKNTLERAAKHGFVESIDKFISFSSHLEGITMGFVTNAFQSSTNTANGAGFQAQGANPAQQNAAQNDITSGLAQQQNFVNALAAQNGVGNQSAVYNALQGVANGTGPNPAQAMLNQQTGNNIAQQASLMAGQRGASANTGLIARQAAQQGAATQQNAVGQGASLQAQQSLNALAQQQALAGQQVGQQQGAMSQYQNTALGNQGNLLGIQANVNNANEQIAGGNAQFQHGMLQGIAQNAGAALNLADGGSVPAVVAPPTLQQTSQATVAAPPASAPTLPAHEPQSAFGRFMNGLSNSGPSSAGNASATGIGNLINKGIKSLFSNSKQPGNNAPVDPSLSAANQPDLLGEGVAGNMASAPIQAGSDLPVAALAAAKGGAIRGEQYAHGQKKVPGKPKVAGDSLKNDTVPALLSPGEIIIPRSHAQDPHMAAAFARATVLKNKGKMK